MFMFRPAKETVILEPKHLNPKGEAKKKKKKVQQERTVESSRCCVEMCCLLPVLIHLLLSGQRDSVAMMLMRGVNNKTIWKH